MSICFLLKLGARLIKFHRHSDPWIIGCDGAFLPCSGFRVRFGIWSGLHKASAHDVDLER